VSAPGHSRDHVVYFASATGALFTGDALLGRGTSVIDPPEGDLAQYLDSLARMLALAPTAIHPGHGPVVADAPGLIRQYLEHRGERERQVVDGLASGARTPAELVGRIYLEERPELRAAAERSVLAHLLKLEAEGRVVRTGDGFALATGGEERVGGHPGSRPPSDRTT
jgi:glyoxylase-like metal-dependent hydrolase (beta-lactamase superfamily II)